jgi:hypothetical protein
MKCISAKSDVQFDTQPTASASATKAASTASPVANVANDVLIKNITYFKDYFDKQ